MAASDQIELEYYAGESLLLTNVIAGHGPLEVIGVLGHELLDDVHLLHEELHGVAELGLAGDVGGP